MIKIRVKQKETDRMFVIWTDSDKGFQEAKDRVKATGAKFDGFNSEWVSDDIEAIRAIENVELYDFKVNPKYPEVIWTGQDNYVVWRAKDNRKWMEEFDIQAAFAKAREIKAELQAALDESVSALAAKSEELGLV